MAQHFLAPPLGDLSAPCLAAPPQPPRPRRPTGRSSKVQGPDRCLPSPPGAGPQHLLRLACKATHASQGGLGLLSSEGKLVEHFTHGMTDETTALLGRSPWLAGLVGFLAKHEGPVNLADLGRDLPDLAPRSGGPPAGFPLSGPFLGIGSHGHPGPGDGSGRRQGVLYLLRPDGAPAFGPEDEEMLLTLSSWFQQGSRADEGQVLARFRLLNQVAQAAAGSLDMSSIFTLALRELDRHLPRNVCAVWLAEGLSTPETGSTSSPKTLKSRLTLAALSDTRPDGSPSLGLTSGLHLGVDETCFADCLESGQALYADLTRPEERGSKLAQACADGGATSSFAVPLRAGERTLGVLQSVCFRPAGFTSEQIQLFYLVADLLGPAISNCQLYDRLRTAYEDLRFAQQRLIQTEKMRALGELAGGMAHEFNNALCGSLGFLELALRSPSPDPVTRGYLESARTCTWDAAQTVRRVQAFARQRARDPLDQRLDLNELVRQMADVARLKGESSDRPGAVPPVVEIQAEGKAWVCGDVTELRQVVTNLVFNAVDAMPQGGTLTLRTQVTPTQVYLTVQDTGCGISEAVRHRLFEPFFTTKGERGNGLGLSVVYGIVRRHGGEIAVQSEVGRGTTFTITLPGASETTPTRSGAASLGLPRPPSGTRVLVIEDQESIARFLITLLTHLGCSVQAVGTGEEGLEALARERFDVVFTDLALPGISGQRVAQAVARSAPGKPVVMLTGQADRLEAEGGLPEGVTRLLAKPVTLETLASTLAGLFQKG